MKRLKCRFLQHDCTDCTIRNTVYYAALLMMND